MTVGPLVFNSSNFHQRPQIPAFGCRAPTQLGTSSSRPSETRYVVPLMPNYLAEGFALPLPVKRSAKVSNRHWKVARYLVVLLLLAAERCPKLAIRRLSPDTPPEDNMFESTSSSNDMQCGGEHYAWNCDRPSGTEAEGQGRCLSAALYPHYSDHIPVG